MPLAPLPPMPLTPLIASSQDWEALRGLANTVPGVPLYYSVSVAAHLLGFSIRVAVGQTSMQAPQKSQSDSCTGPPVPKAIAVVEPLPESVIAPVWRRSAQARTQLFVTGQGHGRGRIVGGGSGRAAARRC